MFRPSGLIVLSFWIKKAFLVFRMESRLEKILIQLRFKILIQLISMVWTSQKKPFTLFAFIMSIYYLISPYVYL